jgi:hypothetical protein
MTWLPDYVGGLRHLGLSCSMVISPILARSFSDSVRMLHGLHAELASHDISLRIVGARGRVRDLLRADGIADKVGGLDRLAQIDDLIRQA